jgi:hypothetical protein
MSSDVRILTTESTGDTARVHGFAVTVLPPKIGTVSVPPRLEITNTQLYFLLDVPNIL